MLDSPSGQERYYVPKSRQFRRSPATDPAAPARMGATARGRVNTDFSVRNPAEGILGGLALVEKR